MPSLTNDPRRLLLKRNYDNSTTPISVNHFSNRIEIQNPGSLFGDLTRGQFPHGVSYRSPVLAEVAYAGATVTTTRVEGTISGRELSYRIEMLDPSDARKNRVAARRGAAGRLFLGMLLFYFPFFAAIDRWWTKAFTPLFWGYGIAMAATWVASWRVDRPRRF